MKADTVVVAVAVWIMFVFLVVRTSCSSLDEPVDRTGWTDPHDMGGGKPMAPSKMLHKAKQGRIDREADGGDHAHGEALRQEVRRPGGVGLPADSLHSRMAEVAKCGDAVRDLEGCRARLRELEVQIVRMGTEGVDEEVEAAIAREEEACPVHHQDDRDGREALFFLKRYTRFLVRQLDLASVRDSGDDVGFDARVILSPSDARTVINFANAGPTTSASKLVDVDRVLTSLFRDAEREGPKPALVERLSERLPRPEDAVKVALAAAALWAVWMLWRGVAAWKVALLALAVSSAWHWTHLYKKALSRKHTTLVKQENVPVECFPGEMTWRHLLYDRVFRSGDPCAEYHEALLVDPLWEVSPTMAVAETVVQFVLLPMEHLGKHVGLFFSSLLGELSWFSSPMVLAFVFLAILMVMIMACGYRFRLPLFLGSLEPSHRDTVVEDHRSLTVEQLRRELNSLQEVISRQSIALKAQEEVKALEQQSRNLQVDGIVASQGDEQVDLDFRPRLEEVGAAAGAVDGALPSVNTPLKPTPEEGSSLGRSSAATPRKRLVVTGSLTSPGDTGFEWVEESGGEGDCMEEEEEEEAPRSSPSELGASASSGPNKFLDQVESIFEGGEKDTE